MRLGIVIPCFNEAKKLNPIVFQNFLDTNQKGQICFVNDGSTDATYNILENLKKKHPNRIHLIHLEQNKGKASAVQTGIHFFQSNCDCDRVAFLDGDLSTSLEECYELAAGVNAKTKFVFGSRIKKMDNQIDRQWHRFIIGRILATFISKILQLPIYDTQCGCKIFSLGLLTVAFEKPFLSRWLFDVEVFFRLKNHYGSEQLILFSKEIALKKWEDKGDSKIPWSYGLSVWSDLYVIYKNYK